MSKMDELKNQMLEALLDMLQESGEGRGEWLMESGGIEFSVDPEPGTLRREGDVIRIDAIETNEDGDEIDRVTFEISVKAFR